jgi:tetratricopeptide (TPR) repeat protein
LEQNQGPGNTYDGSLLAETLGSRAEAARAAGDLVAAKRYFEDAEALARSISEKNPGDTYYRWVLARILVRFAEFRLAGGETAAGAGFYGEALAHGRALHEGEKPNKRYALVLAESLLGSERLARDQGDLDRAARLRDDRCVLIGDFVRADPEDARFSRLACR